MRSMDRWRRRAWPLAALSLLAASCGITPRADRDWYPYLAETAHVETDAETVTISPVTDWTYDADGPTAQCYREASFDVSKLEAVWFVLEPQPGSRIAAHTFLIFEFEGGQLEALTIEARRERDETYSAFRGMFNRYELAYLWGSTRDLLTRRAVYLDHQVFIYPLALAPEQEQVLLSGLLDRTVQLETRPRFYNTFFSNCTNELAKAVNLPWSTAFILTGTADNHLFRRGIIPGESFEAAQARADMTAFIKEHNDEPDAASFDAAILAELHARLEEIETAEADQAD